MKSAIHETKNLFAAFLLRGLRFRSRCGGFVVGYAVFLMGAAPTIILGSMLALSTPSFAQTAGGASATTPSEPATTTTIEPAGGVIATVADIDAATSIPVGSRSVTSRSFDTVARAVNTSVTTSGTASRGDTGILVSRTGIGDLTLTNNADINIARYGIRASHGGAGILDIINNSRIVNASRYSGIYVSRSSDGFLGIRSNGIIRAGAGIVASHRGDGEIKISNSASIETMAGSGIVLFHHGDGDVSIDTRRNGGINSRGFGVFMNHQGDGDVSIDARGNGGITSQRFGVYMEHQGDGDVSIDIQGNSGINAQDWGIYAEREGSGNLSISTRRSVGGAPSIRGTLFGIYADHRGGTNKIDIDILSEGGVTSTVGDAIFVRNGGYGKGVDLDIRGEIRGKRGVVVERVGGPGDIDVSVRSSITGTHRGIYTRQNYNMDGVTRVNLLSGARITSLRGDAVVVEQGPIQYKAYPDLHRIDVRTHAGSSVIGHRRGIAVYHNGAINNEKIVVKVDSGSSVSGDLIGIYAYHHSSGNIILDVHGEVSSANGNAIDIRGNSSKLLILRPGFSLNGTVVSRGNNGFSYLDLLDAPGNTSLSGFLNLDEDEFRGFDQLLKQGENRWVVTGTASNYEAFKRAYIASGTMRFFRTNLKMAEKNSSILSDASVFVIAGDDASLEIVGHNILRGSLRNNGGSLVFVQEEGADGSQVSRPIDGSLTISGNYWGAGDSHSLDFNVDLAGQRANRLTVEGHIEDLNYGNSALGKTSPGRVSMHVPRAVSDASGTSSPPERERTSPVLIVVKGRALATDFEGSTDIGIHNYALDHNKSGRSHKWRFKYKGPAAHVAAGEATGTTLTELVVGQLPSSGSSEENSDGLEFWDDARRYAGGAWARRQTSRTSLGPGGITGGRLRVEDNRVHFGLNFPAKGLMSGNVVMGASMWQGLSTSNVSSPTGKGSIGVESHAVALVASWQFPEHFYVNGQARYVRFSSDVSANDLSLVRDNEGTGMSASAEAGYRLAVPTSGMDFHIAPQAQLVWSHVGFDDFFSSQGGLIWLKDGNLVRGRLGLSWDGEWHDAGGWGHFYGGMNLRTALDGRTVVSVSGVSFVRKQKGLSVDGRFGVSYEWDDGYAVHGEVVALRFESAEELRANLGVRVDF